MRIFSNNEDSVSSKAPLSAGSREVGMTANSKSQRLLTLDSVVDHSKCPSGVRWSGRSPPVNLPV